MADVASTLPNWSVTESSNLPADATTVGSGMADNFQQIQATVRAWLAHKGADIVATATTDLGAIPGLFHDITGSTGISSFGTVSAGIWKIIKFEGTPVLTHNATSLILPGSANITAAVGDMLMAVSEGGGNWRVVWYTTLAAAANPNILKSIIDAAGDLIVGTAADTAERLAMGTALQKLRVNAGATALEWATDSVITLATEQASTSGTSIDFTGIPSGVKRITIMFVGVSVSGTSPICIKIGTSSGVETSGYDSVILTIANPNIVASASNSGAFAIAQQAAADALRGVATLSLQDASDNTWCFTSTFKASTTIIHMSTGSKALAAMLDRVRVTTIGGTDTFDAGSINISYE